MENTLDLNENDNEGRILVLEPNEKIEYRFLLSKIPKGNYELLLTRHRGMVNQSGAFLRIVLFQW